jgi:hypothetical protein
MGVRRLRLRRPAPPVSTSCVVPAFVNSAASRRTCFYEKIAPTSGLVHHLVVR